MAEDIATLGIEVDSKGVVKASKDLGKLDKQSERSEKQNKSLSSSFGMLKGAIAGIAFGVAIRGIVNTAAAFEKLEASLVTVTGSTEKATQAMEGIKTFATETPFQVQEITDAFIKLKSLGIAPTEENLRSFGNTASAMGKSLNQMIEAIADAATGEFERLKEFGIKAKSEGDKVSFTFQGVTTTIGKNADEITGYLQSIGETTFASGMANQMDTLDGAFSNFSDTVDNAITKLSKESGFNALIKSATLGVSEFIRSLTGTETIDDFKNQIKDVNDQIKVLDDFIAESQKKKENQGWLAGLFTDPDLYIDNARRQIEVLNETLTELQSNVTKAEESAGGIEAAGGLDPELVAAKIIDAEFEKDIILFDMQARRLEMEQFESDEKQRILEERLEFETDYYSRLYNLQAGSLKAGADFAKAIRDGEAKSALQNGALMLGNLSKTNKAAFGVQKAFALANALVTLPSAVMKSFDNGGGYPWGLIPAGLMLAQGMQQISSIRSTSLGGGGAPASVSGGGSTSPSAPVASGLPPGSTALPDLGEQRAPTKVDITLNGAGYSRDDVRELIESINEELGDGMEFTTT